jgi:hypothetical protein
MKGNKINLSSKKFGLFQFDSQTLLLTKRKENYYPIKSTESDSLYVWCNDEGILKLYKNEGVALFCKKSCLKNYFE